MKINLVVLIVVGLAAFCASAPSDSLQENPVEVKPEEPDALENELPEEDMDKNEAPFYTEADESDYSQMDYPSDNDEPEEDEESQVEDPSNIEAVESEDEEKYEDPAYKRYRRCHRICKRVRPCRRYRGRRRCSYIYACTYSCLRKRCKKCIAYSKYRLNKCRNACIPKFRRRKCYRSVKNFYLSCLRRVCRVRYCRRQNRCYRSRRGKRWCTYSGCSRRLYYFGR